MSAGNVATAYVRLRPNAAGFQKEAQREVEGALAGLRKSAAFLIGAGGIAEGLKGIVEAAAGRQSALVQVQTAVKNAGAQWKIYGQTVEDALEKGENRTGFDFEEQAQGFGRLVQQTKNSAEALALLGTAEDISRARHLQLAQVTVALSRAQAGNSQSLSRLGIIVPKYTAQLDELKKREDDIAKAQTAQTQAGAKKFAGTIALTQAQRDLAALSPIQLQNLAAELKAQEAAAAAADKRKGAELAIAEVSKRYSGQAAAYANTAAGSYARFRVAVQQVAEAIGTAALPRLTELAQSAARVALELSENEKVGRITTTVLNDIAGGAQAVATAYHALEPALTTAAQLAQALGPGPILAGIAAYKALSLAQSAQTVAQAKYLALQKAGTPIRVAQVAELEAQATAQGLVLANGARLVAFEAALTEGYSAQTAAVIANDGAMVSNTEVTTLNTAARIRNGEIAALQAEGYSAQTAATILNNGQMVASTELKAANTLATEANTAAQVAGAGATGGFRAALAGLGTKLTGPTGIIVGLAAAAAGIYYLSTIQSDAHRRTVELTDAYDGLATAQKNVRDTAQARQSASSDLGSAERAKADATDRLTQSRRDLEKLLEGNAYTSQQVAEAERRISDGEAAWRDANQRVIDTERAKKDAVDKSKVAVREQSAAIKTLVDDQVKLADGFKRTALGARGGDGTKQLAIDAENYARHLRDVATNSKSATDAQRYNLRALAETIEATGKIPDEKTIRLTLNDTTFYNTLQKDLGLLKGAGQALFDALTGNVEAAAKTRGGVSIPVDSGKVKGLGAKAATDFTTSFVQHLDASQIKTAFTDAITQAQSQLVSEAGTLGSTIGQALDAKLKEQTLPATREIARLQAEIAASQARVSSRDTDQAIADAQKKLGDLQRIFGGGALTADQAQQIAQARVALADVQDAASNDAKSRRATELQAGIDTATKANDVAKAAAQRRLDDLTAQLNDGLITQATYVKRLNALLAKEGVNYKSTGRLLGLAVADGFRDGLASVLAQVAALGAVGRSTLKSSPRGTKAIDPNKAEADAIQAFIDSVAQSGGRFTVSGADKLPAGVTLDDLLARAGSQRGADSYRTKSGQQDKGLDYAGRTADHTAVIAAELKKLNAKPPVVVQVDGRKTKRKTAEATRS